MKWKRDALFLSVFGFFFLYKQVWAKLGGRGGLYVQRFISRDITLRLQSYVLVLDMRCTRAPASVFDFCAISKYMNHVLLYKPEALSKAYNCLFLVSFMWFVFFCFLWLYFCTTSLQKSQTLDIVKCTCFYCFCWLLFSGVLLKLFCTVLLFCFLILQVGCMNTPTCSGIKEFFVAF